MKTNSSTLFIVTLPFIVIIIIGTFVISIKSVIENKRFIDGTNLILSVPRAAKVFLKNRPAVYFTANDDILDMLSGDNLFPRQPMHVNPWNGKFQALAVDNRSFRIYTVVPPSVCRKLSLYFGRYDFSNVGLLGVYVNPEGSESWVTTFSPSKQETTARIGAACGKGVYTNVVIDFMTRP
ncbi:MAG: hypothetical protein FWF23_01865 [Alphaproteobacteria bacterium]|nr:hypothetical protein [Alphaproteobacteria bacterium]MCL2505989.1 hypothetical protein [Alphaproteobacteria bacterium]